MKKILLLVSVFVLAFTINVFADTQVKVLMNDEYINFTDENNQVVNPEITNDRTMVPLRKIFEELGATIGWEESTKTITATKGSRVIKLAIGSTTASLTQDGTTQISTLDSVPYIKEGRTLVPLRFISESLGCLVGWDNEQQTAIIISIESLIEDVLNECTNLKDLVTSVKLSDSKYFDADVDVNLFLEEINEKMKFNLFSNDNGIYLKIVKLNMNSEYVGKYIDLGEIVENMQIEDEDDVKELLMDNYSDSLKIDSINTYSTIKDQIIEVFNNNNLNIKSNGDKKVYTLKYTINNENIVKDSSLDSGISIPSSTDVDVTLEITTMKGNITTFSLLAIPKEINESIEINIDIKYTNTNKSLPSNADVKSVFDLLLSSSM